MTRYVAGFLFTPDRQEVVLIRKDKPTWQAGRLNGVGGKLQDGEAWADCMEREFREETGVTIPAHAWQHTVTLFNEHFECRFFRAFSPEAKNVRTAEQEVVRLYNLHDVMSSRLTLIDNLYWLIPLQLDMGLQFPIAPIRDGLPTGKG